MNLRVDKIDAELLIVNICLFRSTNTLTAAFDFQLLRLKVELKLNNSFHI